jgi:hypothetical protein
MAIDLNTKLDENRDPLPDLNEKHADEGQPQHLKVSVHGIDFNDEASDEELYHAGDFLLIPSLQ